MQLYISRAELMVNNGNPGPFKTATLKGLFARTCHLHLNRKAAGLSAEFLQSVSILQ
jgi:hypothetical protein